jgi:DNA polymerase (family 10)
MRNQEVADLLIRMGTLLELKGELVFKIRAYQKAAENISNLGEDIEQVKNENRLSEIPGVGKTLEEKIIEYLNTGKLSAYQKLIEEIPETLLDIVNVPTVGPKKAKLFFDELKIKTVDELKKAAESKKLLKLAGIKDKTIENILKGIEVLREGQERMNMADAAEAADEIIGILRQRPEVKKISTAGSLRRGCETVGDIDLLVFSNKPQETMEAFVHLPRVKKINAHGETKSSILTDKNVQVDLRIVAEESFGAALLYFTGSKQFNVRIRQIAIKKDMKVNEYGVYSVKGDQEKRLASTTEEDCFKVLGLPFVPPELREEFGEEEIFAEQKIPKLVELSDIKGELHTHSTYSDGHHTIEEMAEAARAKGYQYLALSDHSVRLRVAGGVSPEDLKKKKKEIDALNAKSRGFRILFGTEVEIDTEGNLDYNDEILSGFDVVIAAIHSGFEQGAEQITKRLLKACAHPAVNIIAHPTGVHLGKRKPYDFDFKKVCEAAVKHNVFLEINSFPIRLDLNTANVYYARKLGVKFVINTDAHWAEHMEYIKFGVTIARRGWLSKEDVLNTRSLNELTKMLRKKS